MSMNRAMQIIERLFGAGPAPAPAAPTTKPGTPVAPPAPARPRPGTRPWKPMRRPGVAPRPKARYDRYGRLDTDEFVAPAPKACGLMREAADIPVPPPPSSEGPSPEPPAMSSVCDTIRAGDRVSILTPQGQRVTGRAVMRNRERGCWVLNMGGPHGRPGIADDDNTVKVVRNGKVIYGKL